MSGENVWKDKTEKEHRINYNWSRLLKKMRVEKVP